MKPILEIIDISKTFRIQHEQKPYLSIRDSISNVFKPLKKSSEDFFALKDVTFDVLPGESVGIIGKNGAGKSTLLKILSKITPPTSGKIISRGRIASLLEVGTGFHPELSGRENIFLNGSILGMKRVEIQKNFDAIVDFSGVEKFLDTPLKHYSSGMQLRLAFAVAAFLENEILIIDEVLAVGDAEFQKKCMGKMEDVSKNQGRTILFVSHQMGMVNMLCNNAILLEKGKISFSGKSFEVINHYNDINFKENAGYELTKEPTGKDIYITRAYLTDSKGKASSNYAFNEEFKLNLSFKVKNPLKNVVLGIIVKDNFGRRIFTSQTDLNNLNISEKGEKEYKFTVRFPHTLLTPNHYSIFCALHIPNIRVIDEINDLCSLNIIDTGSIFSMYEGVDFGCVFANCEWNLLEE
ncbi:MAG: ABC transporter ATP-binding protein [Bacteroidetes bacterium]|nr:ABC transporter ATP-binding protein [Bacteroidota bacterium]